MHAPRIVLFGLVLLLGSTASDAEPPVDPDSAAGVDLVIQTLSRLPEERDRSLRFIQENWREGFTPMLLELISLSGSPDVREKLVSILRKKSGLKGRRDLDAWWRELWSSEPRNHPHYAEFKSKLYGLIDPKFSGYFSAERTVKIRLDEVRWGGVVQDGIPPLRDPKMLPAAEADYLDDGNIVFGIEVEGDARAYPKRILAWHEMFVDTVGGAPVAGVYCTLCGTVILYETTHDGVQHRLGTSGFLYRSNKLMYDKATQSLWNTLWGRPVIGPLADRDIELERRSVVTTTWGEWRRRHPDTTVLSLETGHQRDYAEGAAYRSYFATQELMFAVPDLDKRLKNKDEVLALLPDGEGEPLAISADFLAKKRIYHDAVGGLALVVLTDDSGASRAYESGGRELVSWDADRTAVDAEGVEWTLFEDRLEAPSGETLKRLPSHRAFWFGWYSAYPRSRLVK